MSAPSSQTCAQWKEAEGRACGAPAHGMFQSGWCCWPCSPAGLQGKTPVVPDPTLTLAGLRAAAGMTGDKPPPPASASSLMDDRAVRSGKRRSSPERFREAQQRWES